MGPLFTNNSSLRPRFWRMMRLNLFLLAGLLLGGSVQAQVLLSESFDATTFPPTGWTVNGTGTNTNYPSQTTWLQWPTASSSASSGYTNYLPSGTHSGTGMAFYNSWDISAGGQSNLITPSMNFSVAGTKIVTFWLNRNNAQSSTDSVVVLINNTASTTGATRLFGVAPNFNAPSANGWQQYTVNVPATFNSTTQYIIFQAQSNYQTDIFMDDVQVTNNGACTGTPATPTIASTVTTVCPATSFTLTASGITQTGITYQFQVSTNGGTTWANIGTASASTTYTGTGQTTSSQYRVVATCTASGLSSTSTAVSIAQTPSTNCYCTPSNTNTFYYIASFATTGGVLNISNTTNGVSSNGYGQFLSQTVSQTPGNNVNFTVNFGPSGYTYGFGIWVDWNQNGSFLDAGEKVYTSSTYASTYSGTIAVPLGAGTGATRMRIGSNYVSSTGPSDPCSPTNPTYVEFEDYTFNVIALSPCAGTPAASLSSSVVSACPNVPFTLLAQPNSQSGLTYQFQVSTNGGTTWSNLGGLSTSPSYSVASQTVASTYRVTVYCANGSTSATSASITVAQNPPTSCYCNPSNTNSTYYINDFVTTGAITNVNNTNSGFSPGGYGQFLSQVVSQTASQPVNFTTNFGPSGYTYGFAIWVDWNQNGSFLDAGEKVFSSTSYSSTHSGTFTVPATAATGNTRMRIGSDYLSGTGPSSPCLTTNMYVEYEDYTFSVIALTPCTGTVTAGTLSANPVSPCVGDSTYLSTTGATIASGVTYMWEKNTGSGWTTVTGATLRNLKDRILGVTEYRFTITCTATGATSTSAPLTVNPNVPTLPYLETFESITSNGKMPNCMTRTNPSQYYGWWTYTAPTGSYNQTNHTPGGNKYASYYRGSADEWLFTPAFNLQAGKTYQYKFWHRNGTTYNNWQDLRVAVGTTNTAAGMTTVIGTASNPNTPNWTQETFNFICTTTGTYYFGLTSGASSTYILYLTVDDIELNELPPCAGRPTPGVITSTSPTLCPGSTTDLMLSGSSVASGLTYQWYDSTAGAPAWNAITGANSDRLNAVTVTNTVTYYKVKITCTNPGGLDDSTPIFTLTPLNITLPYYEPFESITTAGQLPNCMQATQLGQYLQTWTNTNSTGNHTPGGTDYGVFPTYGSGWFFTPGVPLQVGKTYKFSYWYKTDGPSGTNIRASLQSTVGTGPNPARVTSILRTINMPNNTAWVKDSALFAPTSTGMYVFGINGAATSGYSYSPLYIDDIRLDELPPCTGAPASVLTANGTAIDSLVLCPTSSFTLSGPLTPNSGLVYRWESSLNNVNWSTVAGITTYNYTAIAPTTTRWYRLVVRCSLTNDSTISLPVKVRVDVPQYALLPYVNDFESWTDYCANKDVPNQGNWLQGVPTGNGSWRRNDQGATANWSNVTSGSYAPLSKSGSYSARFHSTAANQMVTVNNNGEGSLKMYLNCSNSPSGKNALYFYNINRVGTAGEDSLTVWLSTNGGLSYSQIGSYDTATNWKLRIIPFTSTSAATIISFHGRRVSTSTPTSDIGIDSVFAALPCTATPAAGTITLNSPSSACAGDSVNFTLTGTSMAGNLQIDWERSTTSATTGFSQLYTTTLADGYAFKTPVFQSSWYRVKITCLTNGQSSYSNVIQVTTAVVPYATLPFTENFEQWQNRCSTSDIPSASWTNNPAIGDRSWRRHDQGATANWNNIVTGQWWPGNAAAAVGTYAARFHGSQAAPSGSKGSLNLYVDCSAPGAKELRYFVNMNGRTASNADSLVVYSSTDAGLTFTRLERVNGTNGWEQRILPFTSTSAQTILRFQGFSRAGGSDIGIDYVQVLNECSGVPVAGTVTGPANVCPGTPFMLTTANTSPAGNLTFRWEVSTTSATTGFTNASSGNQPFLNTSLTQPSWYRLTVKCGNDSTTTAAYAVGLNSFYFCYCASGAQYPNAGPQYRENIGNVTIRNNPSNNVVFSNGTGFPITNNTTAVNSYSNFQNLTPIPLHRDSTYRLTVQQISYTANSAATVSAFIDYNRDGVFNPTTERVILGNTSGTTVPGYSYGNTFTVPAYVTPGLTGMRVILQQPVTTTPNPCGIYNTYGETEDYVVELRYPNCASLTVADAGNAIASDTALCIGNPVTLIDTSYRKDLYGITRQWEMSVNNGASWAAIGAPNSDTLQPIVNTNTWYRYTLICQNGTRSFSNIVRIMLRPSTQCYCPSYATGGPSATLDSTDVGSFSIGNYVFQVGGPHLLNPMAVNRFTNYAPLQVATGNYIELHADSTYLVDIYQIMRGSVHKNAKVTLFMDFNNDLQFSTVAAPGYPSERVLTAYTTATDYYLDNIPVRIPSQQVIANTPTLMRLIINEDTNPNYPSDEGCGIYESGETEDYQVVFRCSTCPVGVNSISSNLNNINLYPNPTTGMATLEFSAVAGVKDVEMIITNVTGQVIKRQLFVQPGSNMKANIDLKEQPRGVYFVEIKADNERIIRKLVLR